MTPVTVSRGKTTPRRMRRWRVSSVLIAILLLGCLALAEQGSPADNSVAAKQSVAKSAELSEKSRPASAHTTSSETTSSQTPSERQLASKSREAAGEEDENAQFKQSPSVRKIASLLGLTPQTVYWISVVFNFVIVAAVVLVLWRANVPAMFRNRTAGIRQAMEEARRTSEEANRRLSEVEARLSRLDAEIGQMQQRAQSDAAAEEARIRAAAAEDSRKIVESAEQDIAAAAKLARRELTVYASQLAIDLAHKQIRIDHATDEALVRTFAEELGIQELRGQNTGGQNTDRQSGKGGSSSAPRTTRSDTGKDGH